MADIEKIFPEVEYIERQDVHGHINRIPKIYGYGFDSREEAILCANVCLRKAGAGIFDVEANAKEVMPGIWHPWVRCDEPRMEKGVTRRRAYTNGHYLDFWWSWRGKKIPLWAASFNFGREEKFYISRTERDREVLEKGGCSLGWAGIW